MAKARFDGLVWGAVSLLLLAPACAEPPGAARIVGPDGTRMLHVHCAGDQVACFQIAGERCPRGYDLSPIFDPHDGNFLVRCREPQASPVIAAAPITNPNASAATVSDRWPPAEVAKPSEPWPTHASTDLPPAPRNANGTVDLGY
ncbi:MAG TPA: hypothetical protein VER11_04595 [Polyangiaceae bacterium]|nr:hypothetical protein [Polyangiaceae bacterium]